MKPLLDTAEKCLPTETTQSGLHFRPLEMEWNMLTRYFFRDKQSSAVNGKLKKIAIKNVQNLLLTLYNTVLICFNLETFFIANV